MIQFKKGLIFLQNLTYLACKQAYYINHLENRLN